MTIYVMVDLETLGVRKNAVISAIGACSYDSVSKKSGNSFYEVINVQSAVDNGLQMDASTVIWWMNQSEEAKVIYRKEVQDNAKCLEYTLDNLSIYIDSLGGSRRDIVLLGNGATFDNVILRNAYEACGLEYPLSFRNDLCYRTLNHFFKDKVPWEGRKGVYHNALNDAETQMEHFIKILEVIE